MCGLGSSLGKAYKKRVQDVTNHVYLNTHPEMEICISKLYYDITYHNKLFYTGKTHDA